MPRSIVLAIVVTASLHSAGLAQTAALFDDSTDVILVDGQTMIGSTATYEAILLFPSDTSANGNVFNEWTSSQEDKVIRSGPSFSFGYNWMIASPTGGSILLMPDVWHHIAFVLDAGGSRLYVDGDLLVTDGTGGNVGDGSGQPHIGAIFRDNALVNSFIGYIETLRISDVARYEGERFDPPLVDFESDENTLLLFNFTEPTGSATVTDSSPNGVTGTLGAGFDGATSPVLGGEQPANECPVANSTIDLFDVSRGATVTSNSGLLGGDDAAPNLFGAAAAGPEPTSMLFRDDQADGFVHYVEWETSTSVIVRGIALLAASDYPGYGDRDFSSFRLLGYDDVEAEFVQLVGYDPPQPYGDGEFGNWLIFCADTPAMTTNRFRAEFVQRGTGAYPGPRIMELDAFGSRAGIPVSLEATTPQFNADLYQPYPNPAATTAEISFELTEPGRARLEVFDLLGRRVAVLADEQLQPGLHTRTLNATGLPRGVYFVRLEVGRVHRVRKIALS